MSASALDVRPRVAVFCRSFLPISETFVYDAVTRLKRYRASVFCANLEHTDKFPYHDVRSGWPGYRATMLAPNFVRAFLREDFTLLHAHFGTAAVYALPYARFARVPLVVTFHGYDVPLLFQARRVRGPARRYAWFGSMMLRSMTLGLCDSAELRDMLIARGVPPERLRVHLLGVDTERFRPVVVRPGDEQVRVLMVGRLVEKKGFEYGIAAFAKANLERRAQLTIIGEGPLERALRSQVRGLGIEAQVEFTGALPHDRVLELMQAHHILLAPSVVARNGDRDSGLIVLREAAACGLVAIGSRHGGLPDSIEDGETGFLVDERDVQAMSDRLRRLVTDAALRRLLASAARRKMEREFDHSVSMPVLEAAYDDARRLYALPRAR